MLKERFLIGLGSDLQVSRSRVIGGEVTSG